MKGEPQKYKIRSKSRFLAVFNLAGRHMYITVIGLHHQGKIWYGTIQHKFTISCQIVALIVVKRGYRSPKHENFLKLRLLAVFRRFSPIFRQQYILIKLSLNLRVYNEFTFACHFWDGCRWPFCWCCKGERYKNKTENLCTICILNRKNIIVKKLNVND